jgi:hypothetical protein
MPDSWCIYHVKDCIHAIPRPKNKYIAIVCVDPCCVGFFINSGIRPFTINRPELSKCHVKILKSNYQFLKHDSYIDCNEAYEFRKTELQEYIKPINAKTKAEIIEATRNSIMIQPRYQKMILGN